MEVARTALGFVAAVSVPTGFAWHVRRPWKAMAFTLLYALFSVAPSGISGKEAAAGVCVTALSVCLALWSEPDSWKLPRPHAAWSALRVWWAGRPPHSGYERAAVLAGAVAVALLGCLGFDAAATLFQREVLDDDRLVAVVSGILLATFGCQQLISRIVRPLVNRILEKIQSTEFDEDVEDFIRTGPYVGWIERFILFSFLASGNPAAAALVVTAKSLARFPEIRQAEKLVGDYYLVGTLSSVAVALATSGITRMTLGMPPI